MTWEFARRLAGCPEDVNRCNNVRACDGAELTVSGPPGPRQRAWVLYPTDEQPGIAYWKLDNRPTDHHFDCQECAVLYDFALSVGPFRD